MANKSIKWGCIQPLTGGMYLGAELAIGNKASWIISYPGLTDVKYEKDGKTIRSTGNEFNLTEYLKKVNRSVPYFTFNHGMFDNIPINEAKISGNPDFNSMDIVVAVPVCSGLSQATIADDKTKDARNCNMKWITNYTLSVIKPKIYIFENAPGLMATKGDTVREDLEYIAEQNHYSLAYFKTDTQYHHNCQKRPRTFCVFQKWTGNTKEAPSKLNFEHAHETPLEYLSKIPNDATQQITFNMSLMNQLLLGYIKGKFGDGWRRIFGHIPMDYIINNNLYNEFKQYIDKNHQVSPETDKIKQWIDHVEYKKSQGLNYYSTALWFYDKNTTTPSVQFKSLQCLLHHSEDRLLTVREALWLMGMPHDFELQGNKEIDGPKIGQNVPVGTAKFIVSEAVKIINNWDNQIREKGGKNIAFYDNIKEIKIL